MITYGLTCLANFRFACWCHITSAGMDWSMWTDSCTHALRLWNRRAVDLVCGLAHWLACVLLHHVPDTVPHQSINVFIAMFDSIASWGAGHWEIGLVCVHVTHLFTCVLHFGKYIQIHENLTPACSLMEEKRAHIIITCSHPGTHTHTERQNWKTWWDTDWHVTAYCAAWIYVFWCCVES